MAKRGLDEFGYPLAPDEIVPGSVQTLVPNAKFLSNLLSSVSAMPS